MTFPVDVAMPTGAVSLGADVVCDGFIASAKARVQTHIHVDHMSGFETSKGLQSILVSEATRQLLIAEYNAELPYRTNLKSLKQGQSYEVGDSKVALLSSGHMLGAVQVAVELQDGVRVGYSGDFQWPIEEVVQVDALVVDSTYGAPTNIREFSQGECEEQFVGLLHRLIATRPVIIKAHRGTLQRALQIVNDEIGCPVVGSQRLSREVDVYREFGYTIGPLIVYPSSEASAKMAGDRRYVRVYGTGDHAPTDIGDGCKIVLSAYFTRPDTPVIEYSDRAFGVAISNHADFEGTLEYVRSTNAKFVVTDNTRGKGHQLAIAIKQRLGIEARPSSSIEKRGWGE